MVEDSGFKASGRGYGFVRGSLEGSIRVWGRISEFKCRVWGFGFRASGFGASMGFSLGFRGAREQAVLAIADPIPGRDLPFKHHPRTTRGGRVGLLRPRGYRSSVRHRDAAVPFQHAAITALVLQEAGPYRAVPLHCYSDLLKQSEATRLLTFPPSLCD